MDIVIISRFKQDIRELGDLIQELNENNKIAGVFNSIDDFEKGSSDIKHDLIFCDVDFAGDLMLSIMERRDEADMPLVLMGKENMLPGDAFRMNIVAYLLFPLTLDKVREAFIRLRKRVSQGDQGRIKDDDLIIKQGKMMIRSMGELYYIDYDDIFFLEAAGSYCILHFIDMDKTLMVSLNLSKVEDRLPADRFYRIHDRHTINCRYLFSVSSCDRKCKLKNPLTKVTLSLKISERRYKDFTRFINDFMLPE